MSRAARNCIAGAPQATPLKVFTLRCWARAVLWQVGEMNLHIAVDELQIAAEDSGLIAAIGQGRVQRITGKHSRP